MLWAGTGRNMQSASRVGHCRLPWGSNAEEKLRFPKGGYEICVKRSFPCLPLVACLAPVGTYVLGMISGQAVPGRLYTAAAAYRGTLVYPVFFFRFSISTSWTLPSRRAE